MLYLKVLGFMICVLTNVRHILMVCTFGLGTTCISSPCLQDWIEEMPTFVKSIDRNHLPTVGLGRFYGTKSPV
ncbi:hypothetical protein ACS0TY_006542 [Phlomoides rotata]